MQNTEQPTPPKKKGNRIGNPNGAGRKPKGVEVQISRIADQQLPKILLKSAQAVNKFFNSRKFTLREKAELGAKFLVKAMPQRFEGEVRAQVVAMGTIKVGATNMVFDIGS